MPMSQAHLVFLRANQGHRFAMKKLAAKAPLAMQAMKHKADEEEQFNPDSELVLHEFVAAVVRLAHARLQEPADDPLNARVERLMRSFILPNCARAEESGNAWHRSKMAEEPLSGVYLSKEKALRYVFEGYASLDDRDRRHAKDLNVTEFLRMMYDAKLLDSKAKPGGMAGGAVKASDGATFQSDAMAALGVAKMKKKRRKERDAAATAGANVSVASAEGGAAKFGCKFARDGAGAGDESGAEGGGFDAAVRRDGLTVQEAIEVFVMSQIEGEGEGVVQMDYEVGPRADDHNLICSHMSK